MIETTHIISIPVKPEWLNVKLQPIAQGVYRDCHINPWAVLYRSKQEQSVIDHQLTSYRRAMERMLTAPLDQLENLPLLSNSRMMLSTGPWTSARRGPMAGKFKEK